MMGNKRQYVFWMLGCLDLIANLCPIRFNAIAFYLSIAGEILLTRPF